MLLRHTLDQAPLADIVERGVARVLDRKLRTGDIYTEGTTRVGTRQMGDAVVAALYDQRKRTLG
jgi:3-isopropylmalate dehydrogenase